jgi:hypothetical protein
MKDLNFSTVMSYLQAIFAEAISWVLVTLHEASSGVLALLTFLTLLVSFGVAWALQSTVNRSLKRKPDEAVSFWKLEFFTSLPGLIVLPFYLVWRMIRAVAGFLGDLKKKPEGDEASDGDDSAPKDRTAEDKEEEAPPVKPCHVASIGPSFVVGAFITVGLYVLVSLAEPVVASQLGLSPGYSPWEYIVLGSKLELAWYVPLDRHPYTQWLIVFGFWTVTWWWCARLMRLVWGGALGSNLISVGEYDEATESYAFTSNDGARSTLSVWPAWFAMTEFAKPDASYTRWARWLPAAAVPFLALCWASLGGELYRLTPGVFAVSLLTWFAWCLSLVLRGILPPEPVEIEEARPKASAKHGWPEVRHDMEDRLDLLTPVTSRNHRYVQSLWEGSSSSALSPLVCPLLLELVPDGHMSYMQRTVVELLTSRAYIHLEPPQESTELALRAEVDESPEDVSGMRSRNLIVLAPEGAGKSTLAVLSACNQCLVHTASTLIITRNQKESQRLEALAKRIITPSTLRWNIGVYTAGSRLSNDMASGILPDIVIADLAYLSTTVLEHPAEFSPFFRNLGLVIVEDVELYSGPVEVHAQLVFRRLSLRIGDMVGMDQRGTEAMPQMLILGSNAMHDMPSWIRALCSVDAVARYFGKSADEIQVREESEAAARGLDLDRDDIGDQVGASGDERPLFHSYYRLQDFKTSTGDGLRMTDVVDTCERLSVPWHYRRAGDSGRQLGRHTLLLKDEPRYFEPQAHRAAVVLLEGQWSDVERELDRLAWAGMGFSRIVGGEGDRSELDPMVAAFEHVAFITLVDSDQDMAFTQHDENAELSRMLQTLPRPVVRPPLGLTVHEHLAAELVSHWVEVADVVQVFGNAVSDKLRELADHDLLLTRERVNVAKLSNNFSDEVMVRALARALPRTDSVSPYMEGVAVDTVLPRPVSQVELASNSVVNLRDHTSLHVLDRVDASSSAFRYFPGAIFTNARGTYVVVGNAKPAEAAADDAQQLGDETAAMLASDIIVEPFQNDDISSPRRRYHFAPQAARKIQVAVSGEQTATVEAGCFGEREPLRIGERGMQLLFQPVTVRCAHYATFRLGPDFCEVRQRSLQTTSRRRAGMQETLSTEALFLYPEPTEPDNDGSDSLRLKLSEARLIVSAMRSVLPSMYRGAMDNLGVALFIPDDDEAAWGRGHTQSVPVDHVFRSNDAIVLYDLHEGGNGTARALHRDGLDLLLRLVRLMLERVLYHDRLLARYDYWADSEELFGLIRPDVVPELETELETELEDDDVRDVVDRTSDDASLMTAVAELSLLPMPDEAELSEWQERLLLVLAARHFDLEHPGEDEIDASEDPSLSVDVEAVAEAPERSEAEDRIAKQIKRDESRRHEVLAWLDAHLRPEGGAASSVTMGQYGSGLEQGEGDAFDIGRCWYSCDGSVTNLVWTKHRWRSPDGGEFALDYAVDRKTASVARTLNPQYEPLDLYMRAMLPREEVTGEEGDDTGPELVLDPPSAALAWIKDAEASVTKAELIDGEERDSAFLEVHQHLAVYAGQTWPALGPLEQRLSSKYNDGCRRDRARLITSFVQGIPTSAGTPVLTSPQSPVTMLMSRSGDLVSKALLLMLMAKRSGIPTGMFVSLEEGRCLPAVGMTPSGDIDINTWKLVSGKSVPPRIWAVLQPSGGMEDETGRARDAKGRFTTVDEPELVVPVDVSGTSSIGDVEIVKHESWLFLPFESVFEHWCRPGALPPGGNS